MNQHDVSREELHGLMMAVLDGEASTTECETLDRALAADPALKAEYDELVKLKELTMKQSPRDPGETLWHDYWGGVYRRLERGIGWILLSVGAIPVLAYVCWQMASHFFTDPSIALWLRLSGGAMGLGLIILFVSVLRETVFFHKRERYKDIER